MSCIRWRNQIPFSKYYFSIFRCNAYFLQSPRTKNAARIPRELISTFVYVYTRTGCPKKKRVYHSWVSLRVTSNKHGTVTLPNSWNKLLRKVGSLVTDSKVLPPVWPSISTLLGWCTIALGREVSRERRALETVPILETEFRWLHNKTIGSRGKGPMSISWIVHGAWNARGLIQPRSSPFCNPQPRIKTRGQSSYLCFSLERLRNSPGEKKMEIQCRENTVSVRFTS